MSKGTGIALTSKGTGIAAQSSPKALSCGCPSKVRRSPSSSALSNTAPSPRLWANPAVQLSAHPDARVERGHHQLAMGFLKLVAHGWVKPVLVLLPIEGPVDFVIIRIGLDA